MHHIFHIISREFTYTGELRAALYVKVLN